jgi:hypothetical protein
MAEIRNVTRNGETFYPLTCTDAVVDRDGNPLEIVNDIFDISEYNASGTPPVLAKYSTLALALAAVPQSKQKGGMTIRYVQTSDNKYVQYRLMAHTFSTTESDWQGVDDEPTLGSVNLVESDGIFKDTHLMTEADIENSTDKVFLIPNGSIVAGSTYKIISYKVEEGKKYRLKGYEYGGVAVANAYSSASFSTSSFLQCFALNANDGVLHAYDIVITAPTGCNYIGITQYKNTTDDKLIKLLKGKNVVPVCEELINKTDKIEDNTK